MDAYLPILVSEVPCGFPSPAADSSEEHIDLEAYLVRHPYNTCCVRARGDSMIGAQIADGDILLVDRQVRPKSGDIVLAMYDGAFVVKRLIVDKGCPVLHAENPSYRDIRVTDGDAFVISGVVVGLVRKMVR